VDHRLIRHAHLGGCDHSAWALYLFLITVGDVQGLSYYSDAAISRHLKLDLLQLAGARQQLLQADLIAYHKPLYQVLSLPEPATPAPPAAEPQRAGQVRSVGDILRQALSGGTP
jgi:hypothetical protein